MLREIVAAPDAAALPPKVIRTAAALENRGLMIKRTWRNGGSVAVVTADGRHCIKHGEHPREERERATVTA